MLKSDKRGATPNKQRYNNPSKSDSPWQQPDAKVEDVPVERDEELESALGSIGAEVTHDDHTNVNMEITPDQPAPIFNNGNINSNTANIVPEASKVPNQYFPPDLKETISHLPSGLQIIPRTKPTDNCLTSTYPDTTSNISNSSSRGDGHFPVQSSSHPSLTQNIVTIEKVDKASQQRKLNISTENYPDTVQSGSSGLINTMPLVNFPHQMLTPQLPDVSSGHGQHVPTGQHGQYWSDSYLPNNFYPLHTSTQNWDNYYKQFPATINPSVYYGQNNVPPYGVNIKTEPNQDALDASINSGHSNANHNNSVELEEFVNNDVFNSLVKNPSLANEDIKKEVTEEELDNKSTVQSQISNMMPSTVPEPSNVIGQTLNVPNNKKVVTLFPPNFPQSDKQHESVETPSVPEYKLSKVQLEKFRTVAKDVIKNEISISEAASIAGN